MLERHFLTRSSPMKKRPAPLLGILCGLTLLAASQLAAAGQLATPKPHAHSSPDDSGQQDHKRAPVYDESANGKLQIQAALVRAKRNHRRVLIQWGANWCKWCLLLDKKFREDPDIRKELLYEYDLVHIDVGRFDKHMELAARYGIKLEGVPHLTILDAAGNPIAQIDTGPLEEKQADGSNGHSTERILVSLKQFRAPRVKADALLKDALAHARAAKKRVFLTFGAPW